MRQLILPACLCLASVAFTTGIGSDGPMPVMAIATSTHANNNTIIVEKFDRLAKNPDPGTTATTGSAVATPPAVTSKAPMTAGAIAGDAKVASAKAVLDHGHDEAKVPKDSKRASDKHKGVVHRSQHDICATLAKAAENNNLPVPFFIRLLFQESKFQAGVVSHAGAQGIAQFMPKTAAEVGLDNPFDPLQAIPAAAHLLRDLVDQFGNLGLAAAAYNAGPGRVDKWLKRRSKLPAETRGYVKNITGKPADSWRNALPAYGESNLPDKAPCKAVAPRHPRVITASVPMPPVAPRRAAIRVAAAAKAAAKTVTSRARKAVVSTTARAHSDRKIAIELAARRHRSKRARD